MKPSQIPPLNNATHNDNWKQGGYAIANPKLFYTSFDGRSTVHIAEEDATRFHPLDRPKKVSYLSVFHARVALDCYKLMMKLAFRKYGFHKALIVVAFDPQE